MTPRELYALPSQTILYNPFESLIDEGWNHTNNDVTYEYGDKFKDSERLEVRVIKHFDFDFKRFWRLATVWFDEHPVMIIQNAGRWGRDHHKRFITDSELYKEMVVHIRGLKLPYYSEIDEITCIGVDDNNENLTEFYGNELHDYFETFR